MGGNIWQEPHGTQRLPPPIDPNNHMPTSTGGGVINPMRGAAAQPGTSATPMATPPGAMAGSGPGLGNQWPKRMPKKMPKK